MPGYFSDEVLKMLVELHQRLCDSSILHSNVLNIKKDSPQIPIAEYLREGNYVTIKPEADGIIKVELTNDGKNLYQHVVLALKEKTGIPQL